MSIASTPRAYLDQWLATASKGKIVPHYAILMDRIRLQCLTCNETLTTDAPKDTTIDSKVQSFVNWHLHKSGVTKCPKCGMIFANAYNHFENHSCEKQKAYAVTLDFKPVGKIDESPAKAKQIVDATAKTMEDYSDAAVAKKLATLMTEDQGKVVPLTLGKVIPIDNLMKLKWHKYEGIDPSGVLKGNTGTVMQWKKPDWTPLDNDGDDVETATDEELAELQKKATKLKAIENALKIKELKAMIENLKPLADAEPKPKTPIADGVLVTGRKFR